MINKYMVSNRCNIMKWIKTDKMNPNRRYAIKVYTHDHKQYGPIKKKKTNFHRHKICPWFIK